MYKQILLPVDLAQEASWEKALPTALKMTLENEGRLHVITVVPDPIPMYSPYLAPMPADWSTEHLIAQAEEKLTSFVEEHVPEDISVTGAVVQGSIGSGIVDYIEENGIDLTVMASHNPEFKDYFIGPNAAHVVRHAACSIFVVRSADEDGHSE